ncbi:MULTISPECIES: hypothetical protein [unclassified Methylobacterium]|uniref:hypothetical protein n=1 Tax=unclassified Methylobacterium TaxID=2615210 RepID=UPI00031938EB|nr:MULTISPECIES: hypothetical protein [Methylobacterium]WFT80677.1 hypothetical protein QA634_01870 [Methylobacterium nodulans]
MIASGKASASHPEVRRGQLSEILLSTLKRNPEFNGTYSAWEPDALDGSDARFAGRRDAGSDQSGRALPYWTRNAEGRSRSSPSSSTTAATCTRTAS